jgi:hypothetical protein
MADAAIDPNAAAKYPELGIREVWDSIAPVMRSSATPLRTLFSIYILLSIEAVLPPKRL